MQVVVGAVATSVRLRGEFPEPQLEHLIQTLQECRSLLESFLDFN